MKIIILGGSPKGETSVTMQYVQFIRNKFPEHELEVRQVAQPIRKLEQNEDAFKEIIEEVRSADGVIWAFPLYVFLVCSQYKRFIELIWERKAEGAFKGKYAAALSTSIHFYDHTAHNYMRAICDDLEMKYAGCHSAAMRDLMTERGRETLTMFAESFFEAAENGILPSRAYHPIKRQDFTYRRSDNPGSRLTTDKRIVVVTDTGKGNTGEMIEKFTGLFSNPVEVINLNKIDIKGGCLGCLKCGSNNVCAYTDEYMDMYNTRIKTADILIFAGEIRDRYLSSKWKQFFDRSFFNTHKPSLQEKQIGFLISGPLAQIPNLREILTAWVEIQGAGIVDFVTDEEHDSAKIDAAVSALGERLLRFACNGYIQPATFLGVGGMKVFRDEIWGGLSVVFKADHRYYKKNGIYDFPQKKVLKIIFIKLLYLITCIPAINRKMTQNFKKMMIMPYRKILNPR